MKKSTVISIIKMILIGVTPSIYVQITKPYFVPKYVPTLEILSIIWLVYIMYLYVEMWSEKWNGK